MGEVLVAFNATKSIFATVIDLFNCVQTARHLELDAEDVMLRLGFEQLRLSRWGQAAGVYETDNDINDTALRAVISDLDELALAKASLSHLKKVFEKLDAASERIGRSGAVE